MYFKIEYLTPTASFEHTIRTEHSDIKAVMTAIEAFLETVMEGTTESEDVDQVRKELYAAVDEIIEEMQANG